MYKVKALQNFERVVDNEVGRPRKTNEEFVVSEERLKVLQSYHKPLVEVIEEVKEEAKKETKKKGRKK